MIPFDYFDLTATMRGFYIVSGENDRHVPLPDYQNLSAPVTFATLVASATYRWIVHAHTVQTELQSYRLIHHEKAGVLERKFYFVPSMTDEQRITPIGPPKSERRMWPWPMVLKKLWAEAGVIPDTGLDASGDLLSNYSWNDRMVARRGGQLPTDFRITRYLSDQPWPKSRAQTLITDDIRWSMDKFGGYIPNVLHPGVKVPEPGTSGSKIVLHDFGTDLKAIGSDFGTINFPPTPHSDWPTYVVEDLRQDVVPGGLAQYREIWEAIPPIDPRVQTT
jgi:hypothetical protein